MSQPQKPNFNNDVNIDRIVVSNKVPFGRKGFKYFMGFENVYEKVMPLCI